MTPIMPDPIKEFFIVDYSYPSIVCQAQDIFVTIDKDNKN
jgi:hypothetical protein